MKNTFALVDCNNFYASCQRVFNPRLDGRPVVVLSNNDGCIVARSNEAKALGIAMGTPVFKAENIIRRYGVEVFSSNYTLYADMSSRVMQTLSTFTPEIEIYSIDEAFLNLAGFNCSLPDYGKNIRQTVGKWTGIPVSVGIAETKTLAKIANRIAKKSAKADGVLELTDPAHIDEALKITEVEDIWSVGAKTAGKLKRAGIHTALSLRNTDTDWIKKRFGITGVRTVYELRGICCYRLEEHPPTKKGITVSRSFGSPVTTIDELKEATAAYVSRAGEKLRKDSLCASVMTVFAMTSRFRDNRYYNYDITNFHTATNDTKELIYYASRAVEKIYRQGYMFNKAGVMFNGLVPEDNVQLNLFDNADRQISKKLMRTIDAINTKMDSPLKWAAEGINQPWKTKFKKRSKRYTTQWNELLEVV